MLTLQALRIKFGKSYRQTIDLLILPDVSRERFSPSRGGENLHTVTSDSISEMPGILDEIGLTRLPHFTVLRDWFETISMGTYRAFLGESAEKRTGHAAIDSTGFDRDQPSRHYATRAHYVHSLKVTALVDVKTLYVFDVHCTTTKKHDAKIGSQVARRNAADLRSLTADRGYDGKPFRDELRADGIRPLIKHRIYSSLARAHKTHRSIVVSRNRSRSEGCYWAGGDRSGPRARWLRSGPAMLRPRTNRTTQSTGDGVEREQE